MLVLTRWLNQAINIGDEITLKITKVRGSAVSIAIDAPPQTRVQRAEKSEDTPSALPTTSDPFNG